MIGLPRINRGRITLLTVVTLLGAIAAAAPQRAWSIDKTRLGRSGQEQRGEVARGADTREREGARLVRPGLRPRDRWTLGVDASNTRSGVRIDEVYRDTAAWRVGLERRDVVVTVNGYQVGIVGRGVYELGRELNLRADSRGWVGLLVWDHRTGDLVNVGVRLDRRGDEPPGPRPRPRVGLLGQVNFSTRISPRDEAVLVVRLIDASRPLGGLKPVAEERVKYEGRIPMRFRLDVEPEDLSPDRRYALQAYLLVDDRRVLANDPSKSPVSRTTRGPVSLTLDPVRFDRRRRP
jgi:uncharacterized lipoprotein YbaY